MPGLLGSETLSGDTSFFFTKFPLEINDEEGRSEGASARDSYSILLSRKNAFHTMLFIGRYALFKIYPSIT